jgi:hypothetical protein
VQADSIDKIVDSYFAATTATPFTYKGRLYPVVALSITPALLRGYTCPPGCGGCCPTFTLDWLPHEPHPYSLTPRLIEFNSRKVLVFSDTQPSNRSPRCHNLDHATGRCDIHGRHPFSCDFELIGVTRAPEGRAWSMRTRLFSRGWNMKRTDGGRGALCELLGPSDDVTADVVRKLGRLQQWADHFGLETRVGEIVAWAERWGPVLSSGGSAPNLVLRP